MQPCVGIDLGKATLVVAFSSQGPVQEFPNTPRGIRELVKALKAFPHRLCIVEAGSYLRPLVTALHEAALLLRVEDPRRINHFIRADGQRAKTDAIDAKMIALFGETMNPQAQLPPSKALRPVAELETRIRQYTSMIGAEKMRREQLAIPLRKEAGVFIRLLENRCKRLYKKADALIAKDPELTLRRELLCSRVAIKERTSLALLCNLDELGRLPEKQVSALAGVAPLDDQSGKRRRGSHIGGGREAARRALFMVALVAKQCDPEIAEFAKRLSDKGKPKLVVNTAVMHKILRQMNAVLRRGTPWQARTPEVKSVAQ